MKPFFERKIGQLQPENHACSLCRFFLTDKNIQNTLKAKTSTEIDLLRVMSNFIVRTKVHCSEKDATFIRIIKFIVGHRGASTPHMLSKIIFGYKFQFREFA